MAKLDAKPLIEVHRGPVVECIHRGHVAIWHHDHGLVGTLGDATARILPRSSAKMIQALPLVESGAADGHGLGTEHLALACASHNGATIHTDRVTTWLKALGKVDEDLRCGPQEPADGPARDQLICSACAAGQVHNNCSGKHAGFLTLNAHLGGGAEYVEPDHPVQKAVADAWDDVTGEPNPEFAIDGCSAPNFSTRLSSLARAMAAFAAASDGGNVRQSAMARLRNAMMLHPELVAGEGRACTRLMRAMAGKAAVKTGAEGVFIAIVPERRIGVALKIEDGATRASEATIATLLVALGVLDAAHPVATALTHGPIRNRREIVTGHYRATDALTGLQL